MDIQYFFLKEGTRKYDKTELITFFSSINSMTMEKVGEDRVFTYHHPILNFDCRFIMSQKCRIPGLERLNPKYLDVNLSLEFSVILPTYFVEIIIDIVEEIVKKFKFHIYNQAYQDVNAFRRPMMIKAFELWKKSYKDGNEDEIAAYNRLDPQALSQIYNYLIGKPNLEIRYDKNKIVIANYLFLRAEKSRTAFVAVKWDGNMPFILPPAVDIIYFEDSKYSKYIMLSELMAKAEKLFKPIDGSGQIQILDSKGTKKLYKIITKEKFSPLTVELKPVSLIKILDI